MFEKSTKAIGISIVLTLVLSIASAVGFWFLAPSVEGAIWFLKFFATILCFGLSLAVFKFIFSIIIVGYIFNDVKNEAEKMNAEKVSGMDDPFSDDFFDR